VTIGRIVITALQRSGGDLLLLRILQANRNAFGAVAVGIGRVSVFNDTLCFQQALEAKVTRHPFYAAMIAKAIHQTPYVRRTLGQSAAAIGRR